LIAPNNDYNGYGMTQQYMEKFFRAEGIELSTKFSGQKFSLVFSHPPALAHAKGKVKILYSMFESDCLPASWQPYLKLADGVIVPSRWCAQTFSEAGVNPVVIPLSYNNKLFQPVRRKPKEVFTFLHYEAFDTRKGWDDLVEAWFRSLHTQEFGAKLILKTIKKYNEIPEEINQFSNVEVICGQLPHHAIFDLLAEVDCFVYVSRGEGFSLPPLEAMATGLPVIISAGHSHLDYYDEDYMYGVSMDKRIKANHPFIDEYCGYQERVNYDKLAGILNHVYFNQTEARKKGRKAAKYVTRYSYAQLAHDLKKYLNRWL
jgi:glycosyltransferase involved in cell wall biosynthesis